MNKDNIQKPDTSKSITEYTQEQTETSPPVTPEQIELTDVPNRMELGAQTEIHCKFLPEGSSAEVTYTSSAPNVVSVNGNNLTAENKGKAVITAETNGIKTTAEITVFVKSSEIKLSEEETKVTIGESFTLKYKIMPENADKTTVTYKSDNTAVATVSKKGSVKAKGIGTANITVHAADSGVTAVCKVTVEPVHVKTIKLDETKITLGKGQKYCLTSWVSPSNATFRDVEWSSSNNSVVTVKNGRLEAKGVGEANVTASTDRGEKKAVCKIKVQKDAPKNPVYYMRSTYHVRYLPDQNSESLTKVKNGEAVELLYANGSEWLKVRTQNGTVGYIVAGKDVLSSVKPVFISGVPFINQFRIGLPNGCEDVAATMVMQYHGYKVNPEQLIAVTPMGSKKFQKDGVWYGANPFEEFVGDPHKKTSEGAYGCFAKPITTAMNHFAGGRAKNISGCSEAELYNYVAKGHPVVVWGVRNGNPTTPGVTWKYVDKFGNEIGGSYNELVHEHCFVLIGYDDTHVYINDPGLNTPGTTQTKAAFSRNWKKLYKQAIVIE